MTRAKGTKTPHTLAVRPLRTLFVLAVLASALVARPAAAADYEAQIIGGTVASAGTWPGVVLVEGDEGICTGTLIADEWVLTAAHCISRRATIHGGSTSFRSFTWSAPARGTAHPAYDDDGFAYDIGLYQLDEAAPATLGRMAIADPTSDVALYAAGQTLTAVVVGIDACSTSSTGRPWAPAARASANARPVAT